jgi:Family of unknown function (DUF5681)
MSKSKSKDLDSTNPQYKVGYARPPLSTRFAPGQSGNPSGRPAKRKDAAAVARALLDKKVSTTTKHGGQTKRPVQDLALGKLADKALHGDQRALTFLLKLANEQNVPQSAADATISDSQDQELIRRFIERQQAKQSKQNDE